MDRGWFKVWRRWQDHELARDPNAWIILTHILCDTKHKKKINRRYGYTLDRGQCDLTQEQLAQSARLSRKEVRSALDRLERYGTIKKGHIKGHKITIITILNYDTYNDCDDDKGQQLGHKRATPLELEKLKDLTTLVDNVDVRHKSHDDTVTIPDDLTYYSESIEAWLQYRKKIRKRVLPASIDRMFSKMRKFGNSLPEVIDQSIANGWQGLFDIKTRKAEKNARGFQSRNSQGDKFAGGW